MDPEPLLQTVLSGLRDGSPFEEQVIRYMLEMYPLITIDLLVRVTHRIKPHREKDMVSLAAQEWLRQGKAEGKAEGIAEGKIEDILIALETRFGAIPEYIEVRVRQSAPEKLGDMFRRSLTIPSLKEIPSARTRTTGSRKYGEAAGDGCREHRSI
jgi:hypothetical protein